MPLGRTVKVRKGFTILQAARSAGVAIPTRCGGNASCFMCKVQVKENLGLMEMQNNEKLKLAGLEGTDTRLACQAKIVGPVIVELPPDPLRAAIARQIQLQKEQDTLW